MLRQELVRTVASRQMQLVGLPHNVNRVRRVAREVSHSSCQAALVVVYDSLMGIDFTCMQCKEGMASKETYHAMACGPTLLMRIIG